MVEHLEVIKEEAIRFFSYLYSRDIGEHPFIDNLSESFLDESEANGLEKPLFEEEIKDAIFCMTKDKSPGLDGFSILFY